MGCRSSQESDVDSAEASCTLKLIAASNDAVTRTVLPIRFRLGLLPQHHMFANELPY